MLPTLCLKFPACLVGTNDHWSTVRLVMQAQHRYDDQTCDAVIKASDDGGTIHVIKNLVSCLNRQQLVIHLVN